MINTQQQRILFQRINYMFRYLRLFAAFTVAIFLTNCSHANPELGKRLYRKGLLASGEPVTATTQGDISFSGAQFSCVNCHRRSGYGSSEGGNYVLPVTQPSLFNPRDLDRANLFKKLFKEYQPKRFTARMHMPQMRPAYTDKSLAKTIEKGIDPAGTQLDQLMPKYQLPDEDMANLIAYLKTLSKEQDPGVDQEKIYFATVVSDNVDAKKRDAMLTTMRKFFEWMNKDTQGDLRNPNFSPHYRTEFIKAYRLWDLAVWKLKGEPDTWAEQLEDYQSKHPVFAIVSGLVDGPWQPVQQLCESEAIPCLFPHTELPEIDNESVYSVYFNRGLTLEADVIAQYFKNQKRKSLQSRIVQIHDAGPLGSIPANRLSETYRDAAQVQVDNHQFTGAKSLLSKLDALLAKGSQIDTLILWPGKHSKVAFDWLAENPLLAKTVFLPSKALEEKPQTLPTTLTEHLLFSYPFEVPGAYHPRAFRVRGWMNSRGITISDQRLQFNTYYALTMVQYGLEAIVDSFSRDYLLEYVEHEAENALNPGTFPRLSLGPGQRFASKGAYVVKLDPNANNQIVTASDWIVP
ncbi:MAG: c-type cytochrome [Methylococcales bacterium]